MIDKEKIQQQDFYSTIELTEAKWFPIKSVPTVQTLVDNGALRAIDISTNPKYRRFKISSESVINFLERRKT